MIKLTAQQANELRGKYGKYSELNPLPIPFSDKYCISESILTDAEFESIWETLKELPTAEVYFNWHIDKPIRVVISDEVKREWLILKLEHEISGNHPYIAALLEYVKSLVLSHVKEGETNYYYLSTIEPQDEAIINYYGGNVENKTD